MPFVDLASLKYFQMNFGVTHAHTRSHIPSIPVLKSDAGPRQAIVHRNYIFLFVSMEQKYFFVCVCRILESLGFLLPPAGNICYVHVFLWRFMSKHKGFYSAEWNGLD